MTEVLAPLDEGLQIQIPAWVKDNASFLRWAEANVENQRGKIGYFQGLVWIDQTMETFFHNQIKMAIAFAVMEWNAQQGLGRYYGDGMLFSRPDIELSSEPDGLFVSQQAKANRRAWLEKGRDSLVLLGTPDMVLEVVSKSSRKKDTKILPDLYHQAGVAEYWRVDSLVKAPELNIYSNTPGGYELVPSQDGWVKSDVLRATFKLVVDAEEDEVRLDRQA
jgi:Uma2 family endonuclease